MIEVTVKTLDSQNHAYSVPDDITVLQFKNLIASSVAIPTDKQRLIYCGRVLQDERKLSEYDVDGKVIHLVQRAPPSASRPSPTNSTSQSPRQQTAGGTRDGNSFLLGAFTIPSDVMDPNQVQQIVQQVVSGMGELGRNATVMSRTSDDGLSVDVHINLGQVPVQSESQLRINQAQTMIRLANQSLDRLENPNASPLQNQDPVAGNSAVEGMDTTTGARQTPDVPRVASVNISSDETVNVSPTGGSSIAQAARAAAAAAFAAAAEVTHAVAAAATRAARVSTSGTPAPPANDESTSSQPDNSASAQNSQQDGSAANGNRPNVTPRTPNIPRPTRPAALADLLSQVVTLRDRFQPHLQKYQRLLREDPDFSSNEQQRNDAQRTFNCTSEVLHYLSHAYHAISDIMIDMAHPPPRSLRARPLLMQHHAMMPPMQAQINVQTVMSQNPASQQAPTSSASTNSTPTPTTSESRDQQGGTPQAPPRGGVPVSMAELFASRNPIVFMEVGPGSITIDSISAATVGEGGQTGPARFPGMLLSQPPPQDFIQNLMQAVGQAASQRAGNNGQSQARGNTATQPTTATQTRSTPRSIQTVPLAIPGLNSFDPYLPCSSRHLVNAANRRTVTVATASQTNGSPRSASSSENQSTQSGSQTAASADTPLGAMMATVMLSLLGQGAAGSTTPMPGTRSQPPPPPQSFSWPNFTGQAATPSAPPQPETPASSAAPQPSPSDNTVFQLFQRLFNSQAPGTETRFTIGDFLRMVPNSPYQEGEGLLTDLVMRIAAQLSGRDVMNIISGRTEPWQRLRDTLCNFLRENFLSGLAPTEFNIRTIYDREIDDLFDAEFANIPDNVRVREGVDHIATIRNFLRLKLCSLISFILNSPEANFGNELQARFQADIGEFVALAVHCFEDGERGLEQASQHWLRQADLMQPVHQWLSAWFPAQIRSMLSNAHMTQEQISRFIIPIPEPQPANRCSTPTMDEVSLAQEVPEPMDISSSPDSVRVDTPDRTRDSPKALDAEPPSSVKESEQQNWRREVEDEWVPVMSQDMQRQRRQGLQRPLSDAYISIMPSKRRKLMTGGKCAAANDPKNALTNTLKQAILDLGVKPNTSLEEVASEAEASVPLQDAYRQHLHAAVRRRLLGDRDFSEQKFPKSQEYFLGGKNGHGACKLP